MKNNIIWISVIMVCFIFISGCAIGEKRVKLFTIEEPRAPLDLDKPKALNLEDLRWIIITSENADEVFAKLEKEGYVKKIRSGESKIQLQEQLPMQHLYKDLPLQEKKSTDFKSP